MSMLLKASYRHPTDADTNGDELVGRRPPWSDCNSDKNELLIT